MAPVRRRLYQRWLFLVAFLPISGVLCFSELFFIKEPHDVTAMRREAVILDCQAHGESPINVRWLKNGVKVVENERVYHLSNGSLYISEVESRRGDKSDEGLYQCLAQNTYGAILSQKARLTIARVEPLRLKTSQLESQLGALEAVGGGRWAVGGGGERQCWIGTFVCGSELGIYAFAIQPTSIVVTEGSVARFSCKISAHPPSIITWDFNRVTLPLATERITVLPTGVLQILGVQRADAGNYRCISTNIASRRRSTEATLTVTPAPRTRVPQRPRIVAGPQNISVSLHQSAILECMATGNPRPIISWSRADSKSIDVYNTKVLGNGNLIITDIKPQHGGVYMCRATTPGTRNYTVASANITVKLVINQIIPEDDAIYQCQAENKQGSVLCMARLIVVMSEDRPSAPRNIGADTVSSSAILLAWERPQYNSDKVIAYSVHYMRAEGLNNEEYQVVIGNDTTRYIIDDLEPARNYTFYVVAYMPMGASRMSDNVFQHTLEDVPLRAPELSLTSRSPVDIQVSWQPLPDKLSRGRVSAYRLSYRISTDNTVSQMELAGDKTQHLLQNLQPDTIYLLRIVAATSVGWGEQSVWTTHRTPKSSSARVPMAPELHLEPLNCTTIVARWQLAPRNSASVQGYRLFHHEESQSERAPVQLRALETTYTFGGLGLACRGLGGLSQGRTKSSEANRIGILAVEKKGDRLVPPPPPPHNVYTKTNSSTAVFLHWGRPAFTSSHALNYTVRCNPVGLQNASLVLYLQTSEQNLLVRDLEPNTKYEFAIRLHIDQLSSPWSPVAYQSTFPDAPTLAPSNVKVTLIEEDTALVSWKPPDEPNVAVTHYTILYASRSAWIAGEWQVLQREGTITMSLLEKLKPGQIYFVKVSASNKMGDGPFSHTIELTVQADVSSGHDPRGSTHSTGFSDGFYHLDQKSMTGITVGVCIALICIIICAFIIVCRGKHRKLSAVKTCREGVDTSAGHLGSEGQAEHADVSIPMMSQSHFIDSKGGTNLIINCLGPVQPSTEKKEKWFSFSSSVKKDSEASQSVRHSSASYQPSPPVLTYEEELSMSPDQPTTLQALLWRPGDSEGSSNSEGSHATGDSGRYSHDETEMTNLSSGTSSRPPSLTAEESGGSDCSTPPEEPDELLEESRADPKLMESVENAGFHHEAQSSSESALSLQGSDIESLGSEAAVEAELLERAPGKEAELQNNAQPVEEDVAESLDETLEEQTIDEALCSSEAGDAAKGTQHVALWSSSDHSDIVTLGDLKEGEHLEAAAANREFYLGTSCSSQYAFTATEAVYPVQQPPGTDSSSSEDEAGRSTGTVVRRRRLRKNTITIRDEFGSDVPEEQKGISLLTEVIEKIKKENQELNIKQEHIQAQRDDLELLLQQRTEERTDIVSQQQELAAENQLLKTSRERDEESLSSLQLELRHLRSKMRDWEAMGAGTQALLSEIQRLKEQLEEEKRLIESFHSQRADMAAAAQTLNHQLDEERTITGKLRRELHALRNDIPKKSASEAEELHSRLAELEKRLSFEQQRSDMWKKLYVETKGDGERGDESRSKRTNESVAGKVKQTFDAVKNSTKEFVHHHQEQIKKANEAVKENLRKFSDSVKSTFRHFKDSASTFFNKARGFSDKRRGGKNTKESRSHRFHKPPHRNQRKADGSFQSKQAHG
ncbi:Protogenin A [Liparis tanakae]|uniref:Protogenin A n=1 Tax=Liparis tanakae TaxID=230148 RepID=A0A4Z2JBU8_9TELE|nr:Protogenin A [Liparis tanakae]